MFPSRPLSRLFPVAAAVAFALLAGCDSGSSRCAVQGSVSYDGHPVDQGGIAFIPVGEGEGENRVRAAGLIVDGRYELNNRKGPNPGKYRVEITWRKKTGKKITREGGVVKDETEQAIPEKYNAKSELTVEVQPGSNPFDFDLKK